MSNPSDKMQMLRDYRNRSRNKLNVVPEVEIGKPTVGVGVAGHETSEPESPSSHVTTPMRNDLNANGKKLEMEIETHNFNVTVEDDVDNEFDNLFMPVSFNMSYTTEEKPAKNLYEEIKKSIMAIDCTKGLESAYSELDSLLTHMSDDTSSELTNSQILILVSTMIVKLEELNSYNYPELSLGSVKEKLDSDGQKAIYSSSFNMYFFEEFFRYYQSIELEQFNKLKETYNDNLKKFSEFQQKKGEMLMTLLKWLIN